MKKMSTLFKREFQVSGKNRSIILHPEVNEGNEWVLSGEGKPTVKHDGTAVAIINGELYKRYDAKKGKPVPEGAIPCQPEPDPITGHHPCWVKVTGQPDEKYIIEAYNHYKGTRTKLRDGTYEALGPKINGNPDNFPGHTLRIHGLTIIPDLERTYEGIKKFLEDNEIEGIVFHRGNGDMCKIRRKDFGLVWPVKKNK